MHIRWRGLELPSRVVRDEAVSDDRYGRFVIEPFEQGFGTTIGNSLRRVLLSSLEGAAVTTVKIAGVAHEFVSLDGVLEDVTDILLNIKGIILSVDGEDPRTITVGRDTTGEITAGDIQAEFAVTVANPDHLIATLTADVSFSAEMSVRRGRGYSTARENRAPEQELGLISIDSIFSPVHRVRFRTEDMRVGQRTNYDRLIMEVWTDGTVSPEDALVEAGLILRKHLNAFVMYPELGDEVVTAAQAETVLPPPADSAFTDLLSRPVAALDLSVRATNCLEAARVSTIGGLTRLTEADLLRVRSFGKTSLHEVQRKLAEHGLSLGMTGMDLAGGDDTNGPDGGGSVGFMPASGQDGTTPDPDASSPESLDSSPQQSEPAASSVNTGSGPMDQRSPDRQPGADLSVFTMDD